MTEEATEQDREVRAVSSRGSAWLAWSLAGLCVSMFVASVAFYVLSRSAQVPSSWGTNLTISGMLLFVPFLVFPLMGALIAPVL